MRLLLCAAAAEKGHRRALMRRDDQVLSLKSRGFPSALAIKDSLIGLWTPCRCYQLARRRGKKRGKEEVT